MRVLIIANHAITIDIYRREVVEAIVNRGYEVYISAPYGKELDHYTNLGCKIIDTKLDRRGTNPLSDIKLFIKYINIMNEIKPDVVMTYTVKPNLYAGIASRIKHIPYITNVTGLGSGFTNGGIIQKLIKKLSHISFTGAYRVMVQNTQNLQQLIENKMLKNNYTIIPGSGVNLDKYKLLKYPSKEENIQFSFIGRIIKDKGIEEYLYVAEKMKIKYPDVTFNVIGMIDDDKYKDIIKEYDDKNIISYYGFQSDMVSFIRNSHCIINPSYAEGMSNVLLEGAASGRTLIASDIPGCKEIVLDGVNGYTFEVKNTDQLYKCVEKFINLKYEEKVKMGLEGRKIVEKNFDRQIVVDAYIEEINKIDKKSIREVSL